MNRISRFLFLFQSFLRNTIKTFLTFQYNHLKDKTEKKKKNKDFCCTKYSTGTKRFLIFHSRSRTYHLGVNLVISIYNLPLIKKYINHKSVILILRASLVTTLKRTNTFLEYLSLLDPLCVLLVLRNLKI